MPINPYKTQAANYKKIMKHFDAIEDITAGMACIYESYKGCQHLSDDLKAIYQILNECKGLYIQFRKTM